MLRLSRGYLLLVLSVLSVLFMRGSHGATV